MNDTLESIANDVRASGFAFVSGSNVTKLLSAAAHIAWPAFAACWDDLCVDNYMADGGRYRRRRHATFKVKRDRIELNARRSHYQGLDYNRLNGGIHRWFEMVTPKVASGVLMSEMLALCRSIFQRTKDDSWQNELVEMHQFRIEPSVLGNAKPTPEGIHRDGVDWVCVLLIERNNVQRGVTTIHDNAGCRLGSFILERPFDAVFLNDRRVTHGVTPICRIDPSRPGHRDVLVLTFDGH